MNIYHFLKKVYHFKKCKNFTNNKFRAQHNIWISLKIKDANQSPYQDVLN